MPISPIAPPAPDVFGIDAPFGLFVAGGLGRLRQPVLGIFDLDQPDFAEIARLDHFARAPHQGIAGVIMRDRENQAGLVGGRLEFLRLGERSRQRLVADDVNAGLQKGVGRAPRACGWA